MAGSEMVIVVGVVSILVVMIIPLPSIILDFLLALNITLSICILLIAMYTVRPLDFNIFPSLLLVTTLFRLSLNVASTRLILLHGNEGTGAAGKVIMSFGGFVVGGNYVVGLIVFIILVIVNFVVITKGATRIAEVAARFTLDAMPGKQMAIDADLNVGLIDESEAKIRRNIIASEAEFHGSMDGAAKFVRGDAIAGIIITLVNIIGGFVIGVFQQKMSAMDAAQNYTLLTIGDGLVSQIPALTISTAAGIVVSRAASRDTMGREFGRQFSNHPKAIYLSALTIFCFGLIPGLPHLPFLLLSLIIGGGVFLMRRKQAAQEVRQIEERAQVETETGPESVEHLLAVDPLELGIGYGLLSLVDQDQGGEFLEKVRSIRREFAGEDGIIIPPIHIRDNLQLPPSAYEILIKGVRVDGYELMIDHYLAMNPGDVTREIEGIETVEPSFSLPAIWIPEAQREEATLAGYTVVDSATIMATHLTEVLRKHSPELLGRQEVHDLLDNLSRTHPKPVEELVPNLLTIGVLQKVLQNLLQERVPVKDLLTIVETLADSAPHTKDPDLLTESVRHRLARSIVSPHIDENGQLKVITLSQEVEDTLAKYIQSTELGEHLAVDPAVADQIITSIKEEAGKAGARNIQPILLTSVSLRRLVKAMVDCFIPSLMVLSQNELLRDISIQSVGEAGLPDAS